MHAEFTAVDGERFLHVPQQDGHLGWSAAEVGGPHDPWQRFGAGDEVVVQETEQAEVAREQAAMPITPEDLPDNLKLQPRVAWRAAHCQEQDSTVSTECLPSSTPAALVPWSGLPLW